MTARFDAVPRHPGAPARRRRASPRTAGRARLTLRLPGVFSSLMLLGAAGLLTTLGIFLTTQLAGPARQVQSPTVHPPAAAAPIASPTPLPSLAPTPVPTPMPTARVFLLPTPTPGNWCDSILGWSSIADSVCHPFGG